MSCIAPLSSVSASVSRLVWWPFKLAATATTLLLLRLLALALRSLTPTASTPAPDPGNLSDPDDDDDTLDDPPDYQPADDYDNDFWLEYLNASEPHRNCVHHLARCFALDPAKHSH
jgi:hypothetical protein